MVRKKNFPDRREHLLQVADRLFNSQGVEKTTIEDISKASGVPRATIYLEFSGGKENIMMVSLERYLERLLEEMRDLSKGSRSGRLETLKRVMLHYVLSAYDKSNQHKWDPDSLERYSTKIRAGMVEFYRVRNSFFAEILDQAVLAGEVPLDYDTARLAQLISYGLNCFLPPIGLRFSREELERDATAFFSFLLSGLVKQQRKLPI